MHFYRDSWHVLVKNLSETLCWTVESPGRSLKSFFCIGRESWHVDKVLTMSQYDKSNSRLGWYSSLRVSICWGLDMLRKSWKFLNVTNHGLVLVLTDTQVWGCRDPPSLQWNALLGFLARSSKDVVSFDVYFSQIEALLNSPETSDRIKAELKDLILLRNNKWIKPGVKSERVKPAKPGKPAKPVKLVKPDTFPKMEAVRIYREQQQERLRNENGVRSDLKPTERAKLVEPVEPVKPVKTVKPERFPKMEAARISQDRSEELLEQNENGVRPDVKPAERVKPPRPIFKMEVRGETEKKDSSVTNEVFLNVWPSHF